MRAERIIACVLDSLAGADLVLEGSLAPGQRLQLVDQTVGEAIGGDTHSSAHIWIMVASISSVMLMSLAEAWKAFWNITRFDISSSRLTPLTDSRWLLTKSEMAS